jgi:hypothetical protein
MLEGPAAGNQLRQKALAIPLQYCLDLVIDLLCKICEVSKLKHIIQQQSQLHLFNRCRTEREEK